MSDANTNTTPQDDPETITCRICNQSSVSVIVHPWKDDVIIIDPVSKPQGQMFTVLLGTNIKVQNKGSHIHIFLFGNPVKDLGGMLKKVELHLSAGMSLDLASEDLVQITLIKEVHRGDSGEVKCGDG